MVTDFAEKWKEGGSPTQAVVDIFIRRMLLETGADGLLFYRNEECNLGVDYINGEALARLPAYVVEAALENIMQRAGIEGEANEGSFDFEYREADSLRMVEGLMKKVGIEIKAEECLRPEQEERRTYTINVKARTDEQGKPVLELRLA